MGYIESLVLILGGILAMSSVIVAKKPDAKAMIDKLRPYQAIIGIALLALGVWGLIDMLRIHIFSLLKFAPVMSIVIIAMVAASVLLGLMFGMPMVARMSPEGAAKGEEMAKKLAPFHTLIGIVGVVAGLLALLFQAGILKPM